MSETASSKTAIAEAGARLSRPGLAPVLDELFRRYAEGTNPVRLTLRNLAAEHRRAVADLLGWDRLPGATTRLPVDRLASGLGLAPGGELRAAVESLRGPLPDRRAERMAAATARKDLWAWLDRAAARIDLGAGEDHLAGWVAAQRAAGTRGGVAATRHRLARAVRVLAALPTAAPVSLAAFANDHLGDPHALDHGRPLAKAVLDAVGVGLAQPPADTAEQARTLWEAVGVAPDPLSSAVLALAVPGDDSSPLGHWLSWTHEAGEPVVLTLATLRRWPVKPLGRSARLYVVENPSVISAAAARRWAGPPIVCSSGRPSVATVTLIRQLTGAGAQALQHADFDPAGLSITAWLARQAGTVPWRMTADDYLAQLGRTNPFEPTGLPATPWDPRLRTAMASRRHPVYEEQLRTDLLDAMGAPATAQGRRSTPDTPG